MAEKRRAMSGAWVFFVSLLLTAVMILAGLFAPRGWNWVIVVASMLIFIVTLGVYINGRPWGIFIDERNMMTLSRFQLVVWTLIILSAFITITLARVRALVADPLAIELPWQLWALMGISTTSLMGSPLIRSTKKRKTPTDEARSRMAKLQRLDVSMIDKTREGTLSVKEKVDEAQFADMFRGEEVENSPYLDMAKVQMFFFTIIAAIAYAVVLVNWIATKEPSALASFPELSDGLLAILGISHAGYLGNKMVDHTKTV